MYSVGCCVCVGGNCSVDINECESNPCQYNGTCVDLVNGYRCECIPGLTGDNCEVNIDDCESAPCLNGGRCVDFINRYSCFSTILYWNTCSLLNVIFFVFPVHKGGLFKFTCLVLQRLRCGHIWRVALQVHGSTFDCLPFLLPPWLMTVGVILECARWNPAT